MHTSIRRYQVEAAHMDELMGRIDKEFARHIAVRPGFGTYEAIECGGGEFVTISAFVEAEEADASRSLARDWVRTALADIPLEVVEVQHGEILINRADRSVLSPSHSDTSTALAVVRRYALRGDVREAMAVIERSLADPITGMPGFLTFRAIDCGDQVVTVGLFADEAGVTATAELNDRLAGELRESGGLEETEAFGGELRVSRTRVRMLQPAHG